TVTPAPHPGVSGKAISRSRPWGQPVAGGHMAPPNAPIEHPEPVLPAVPQYDEDSLIPLSALQHYLYCPRQCALIHVEQAWAENRFPAEGPVLHERTDSGKGETRHGVRTVRSLPLRSLRYGLTGIADVVEFRHTESGEQP